MDMGEVIKAPRRVAEPTVAPIVKSPERILAPIFTTPEKVKVQR